MVVATAATLLVVYDRLVGTICAGVSSLAMVFFVFHQGLAETLMLLSVVPASVLIVGGATWIASTALAIGFVGSLLIAPDLAHGMTGHAAPNALPADVVGEPAACARSLDGREIP